MKEQMRVHQEGVQDMQRQILAVQDEVPRLRSRLQASEEAMGLIQDANKTVGLKLDNMWDGLSHVQKGLRNFQSQVEGGFQNLKSEGERERMIVKGEMEEHVRRTNSQIREIMPQFVRQVEAIMGPRDSQIVALGQACEALISNQNFLLQNGMGNPAPIPTPVPPRR
jgi:predicted  nucleic acid-binding Zn-ribbon protein